MPVSEKVVVRLSAEQRRTLEKLVRTGTHPAAMRRRAHILLKTDADGPEAWTDERIAEALDTSRMTQYERPSAVGEVSSVWTKHARKSSSLGRLRPPPRPAAPALKA